MLNAKIMAGLFRKHMGKPPRRILEIGAGDGSFMLAVARRLAKRWPKVEVVLIDRVALVSPECRDGFKKLGWRAEAVAADMFDWLGRNKDARFDVVSANLCLHHFEDAALIRLFSALQKVAPVFLAAEPCRAAFPLAVTRRLWLLGANDVTLHDAAVSVRAGFTGTELSDLGRRKTGRRWKNGAPACSHMCLPVPAWPPRACGELRCDRHWGRAGRRIGRPGACTAGLDSRHHRERRIPAPQSLRRIHFGHEPRTARQAGNRQYLANGSGTGIRRVGFFAGGTCVEAPMPRAENGGFGRALGRDVLDPLLLQAARSAGAEIFQPWRATSIEEEADMQAVHIESKGEEAVLRAPVIIAAHGSWELGKLPSQLGKINRPSDLLGFKAHFRNASLAADLMPMLLFPGGYAGMVWADHGRLSLSCCIRRDVLAEARCAFGNAPAADALHRHILASCRGAREAIGDASLDSPWLAAGPIRTGIRQLTSLIYSASATSRANHSRSSRKA